MTPHLYRILFFSALVVSCIGFFSEVKQGPVMIPHFDKVMHFGVFGVLTVLLHKSFNLDWKVGFTLGAIYGALVEIIQGTVAGRHASFGDWFADVLGVIAALYLLKLLDNRLSTERGE